MTGRTYRNRTWTREGGIEPVSACGRPQRRVADEAVASTAAHGGHYRRSLPFTGKRPASAGVLSTRSEPGNALRGSGVRCIRPGEPNAVAPPGLCPRRDQTLTQLAGVIGSAFSPSPPAIRHSPQHRTHPGDDRPFRHGGHERGGIPGGRCSLATAEARGEGHWGRWVTKAGFVYEGPAVDNHFDEDCVSGLYRLTTPDGEVGRVAQGRVAWGAEQEEIDADDTKEQSVGGACWPERTRSGRGPCADGTEALAARPNETALRHPARLRRRLGGPVCGRDDRPVSPSLDGA